MSEDRWQLAERSLFECLPGWVCSCRGPEWCLPCAAGEALAETIRLSSEIERLKAENLRLKSERDYLIGKVEGMHQALDDDRVKLAERVRTACATVAQEMAHSAVNRAMLQEQTWDADIAARLNAQAQYARRAEEAIRSLDLTALTSEQADG